MLYKLGGVMKKFLLVGLLLLIGTRLAFAGQIEDRHEFYSLYDPASVNYVYNDSGVASTGDQVAVNTYTTKTIQVTGVIVNEYVWVRVEGRSKDQMETQNGSNTGLANWVALDTVQFGSASADTSINNIIDVTEHVDFLRVGIRYSGTAGNSSIDVRGIFTNLNR